MTISIIFFLIVMSLAAWGLSGVKIVAKESNLNDKWRMLESTMSAKKMIANALRFFVYGPFSKKLIKKLYDENGIQ